MKLTAIFTFFRNQLHLIAVFLNFLNNPYKYFISNLLSCNLIPKQFISEIIELIKKINLVIFCGAGCAYEAETEKDSFMDINTTSCEHCSVLTVWCLQDLFKSVNKSKISGRIYKVN